MWLRHQIVCQCDPVQSALNICGWIARFLTISGGCCKLHTEEDRVGAGRASVHCGLPAPADLAGRPGGSVRVPGGCLRRQRALRTSYMLPPTSTSPQNPASARVRTRCHDVLTNRRATQCTSSFCSTAPSFPLCSLHRLPPAFGHHVARRPTSTSRENSCRSSGPALCHAKALRA